ncbi:MAG TPA: diacylglycerol kinase, partial [Burkholderiales bacterium]|nr:diacylglycerol kinase [Burkholderiales bacterium]
APAVRRRRAVSGYGRPRRRGLARLAAALGHSLEGLAAALRHEEAFRLEAAAAAVLLPVAFFLPVSGAGRALMIGSVLAVLVVELVNSALEAAVDRVSLEDHPLAKRAKDLASAAVLLSLLNVPLVWLLVLLG